MQCCIAHQHFRTLSGIPRFLRYFINQNIGMDFPTHVLGYVISSVKVKVNECHYIIAI